MSTKHPAPLCYVLSDWEVLEARQSYERGTTLEVLAERYGVHAKTLQRAFKRMDERRGRSDGKGGSVCHNECTTGN